MTGVKELARKHVSRLVCPAFEEIRDGYEAHARQEAARRHDDFLEGVVIPEIPKWLGLDRCERASTSIEEGGMRGNVDAVLRCGDTYVVIEAKSYPFADIHEEKYCETQWTRTYVADYEQLVLYAYGIRKKLDTGAKVRAVLVYRWRIKNGDSLFIIEPSLDDKSIEDLVVASAKGDVYKPGPECLRCNNEKCPIREEIHRLAREFSVAKQRSDKGNDPERAYQELLLMEWCLARHGTRCIRCGPFYFALSQTTIHTDDLPLTNLHIDYASRRISDKSSLQKLHSDGVLIEEDCDRYRAALNKIQKIGDNVLFARDITRLDYFLLIELLSLAGEVYGATNLIDTLKGRLRCYRTYHGKVAQLLRNVAALPSERRTLEGYFLPIIIDRIPTPKVSINEALRQLAKDTSINRDHLELVLGSLRNENGRQIQGLNDFQVEAVKRLLNQRGNTFTIISAPPGAGKTLVFMIYALYRALEEPNGKILIMYPTKKLAVQQLQQLYYTLEELNQKLKQKQKGELKLAVLDGDSPRSEQDIVDGREVRSLKCGSSGVVKYRRKKAVCEGASTTVVDWFTETEEGAFDKQIIITNPYKLSSLLLKPSQASIDTRQISAIIIDEAHTVLDAETLDFLTALLHRILTLRCGDLQACGSGSSNADLTTGTPSDCTIPALILSSATITSSGLPLSSVLTQQVENITLRSIGALERVVPARNETWNFARSLAELLLGSGLTYQPDAIDYYELLGSIEATQRKLVAPMVLFTMPEESYTGTVQEAAITLALAAEARHIRRISQNAHLRHFSSIIFVDSKETIAEVEHYVLTRLLKREMSPTDKTLTKPLLGNFCQSKAPGMRGYEELKMWLTAPQGARDIATYNHLPLFCTKRDELALALDTARSLYSCGKADLPQCYKHAYEVAGGMLNDASVQRKDRRYFLIHHADLDKTERYDTERRLEQAGEWAVVLATSTLELGVNLSGVAVVGQLGVPLLAESIIQRFGRGGRSADTLHTALGVLFTKHTGEDVAMINEDYAVARLFGYKRTPLQARTDERIVSIEQLVAYQYLRTERESWYAKKAVEMSLAWLMGRDLRWRETLDEVGARINVMKELKSYSEYAKRTSLKELVELSQYSLINICKHINNCTDMPDILVNICKKVNEGVNSAAQYDQDIGRIVLRYLWELYFGIKHLLGSCSENLNLHDELVRLEDRLKPIIGALSISASREKLFAYALIPPMPDPRVIRPTINVYIESTKTKRRSSAEISEGYITARPLKVDRY
jgi:superfamily II DNA/RNA helicase